MGILIKFIRLILGVLVIVVVYSCSAPKYVKTNFTYQFSDSNTGLDSLINIEGYYETNEPYISKLWSSDGLFKKSTYKEISAIGHKTIIFYKNGICTSDFRDWRSSENFKYDSIAQKYIGRNIPLMLSEITQNTERMEAKYFYKGTWGNYILSDDTIKVQLVKKGDWQTSDPAWYIWECWYKVIDRNTIIEINMIKLKEPNVSNYYNQNREVYPATFIPSIVPPYEKAWIMKEKWFWKDKDRWKKFKDKQKNK